MIYPDLSSSKHLEKCLKKPQKSKYIHIVNFWDNLSGQYTAEKALFLGKHLIHHYCWE